jgi:hypothetical protein
MTRNNSQNMAKLAAADWLIQLGNLSLFWPSACAATCHEAA